MRATGANAAAELACRLLGELVDDGNSIRGSDLVESAYTGRTTGGRKGAPDMKRS